MFFFRFDLFLLVGEEAVEDVFSFELVEHGIFCVGSGRFGCNGCLVGGVSYAIDVTFFGSGVFVRRAW